jgi:hypothetical protein
MSGGQQQALTVLPEESTPFFLLEVVRINTSTYLSWWNLNHPEVVLHLIYFELLKAQFS